jgi:hypothetical protein
VHNRTADLPPAPASPVPSLLAARQASQQIDEIRKKLLTVHRAERQKLQAALDATQSRLDLLQAGLASLHEVVEFVRTAGGHGTGDLTSSIEGLARTVPNVTSPTATPAPMPNSDVGSAVKPHGSGILGLRSEVSALGRKLRILDEEIFQTDHLRQSSQGLRNPMLAYLDKCFSISANNDLQAGDLQALQQQKAQLDALRVMVKALAPAIVALDKQSSWKLPQRHRSRRICPCEGDVRDPKHSGKTPR